MMHNHRRILKRLRALRKKYKVGQKQIGAALGHQGHSTYSKMESGEVAMNLEQLCAVMALFGASWDELLGMDEQQGTYPVKAEDACQGISKRKEDMISEGDILIVSALDPPVHNDFVVAEYRGRTFCGRLKAKTEPPVVIPFSPDQDELILSDAAKRHAVLRKIVEIRKRLS